MSRPYSLARRRASGEVRGRSAGPDPLGAGAASVSALSSAGFSAFGSSAGSSAFSSDPPVSSAWSSEGWAPPPDSSGTASGESPRRPMTSPMGTVSPSETFCLIR